MKKLSVMVQEIRAGRSISEDSSAASKSFLDAYSKLATMTENVVALGRGAFRGAQVPSAVTEASTRLSEAALAFRGGLEEKTYRLIDKSPGSSRKAARHLAVGASRVQFEKLYAAFAKDNADSNFDDFKIALLVLADSFAKEQGIAATESTTPRVVSEAGGKHGGNTFLGVVSAGSQIGSMVNRLVRARDEAYSTLRSALSKTLTSLNDGKRVSVLVGTLPGRMVLRIEVYGDDNPDRSGWDLSKIAKFLGFAEDELKLSDYNRNGFLSLTVEVPDHHVYLDF